MRNGARGRSVRAATAAALLVLLLALVASPRRASSSPAPVDSVVFATGDLVVTGHGWGHRRGMGQYGALGYAIDHGWGTEQILSHFYGGTSMGSVDPNQEITVRLLGQSGRPLSAQVSSGRISTFVPGGRTTVSAGRAVRTEPAGAGFRVFDAPSCAGPWTARSEIVAGSELRLRSGEAASSTFTYGQPGDVPLVGDWNGDGIDTPGVWRQGVFHLRNSSSGGPASISFSYGSATDQPITGDWDGNGTDSVGIRRGTTFHLRNTNTGGAGQISFSYGLTTDVVVRGDWDGNGSDTIGIRRGGDWHLRNANSSGNATISLAFGVPTDRPVVGDWDGDGRDGVGVRRGEVWYLRNPLSSGGPTSSFTALGPGEPLAGRWVRGPDLVGRFASGTWELATSGGASVSGRGDDLPLDRALQLCNASSSGGWSTSPTSTRYYRGELRAVRATESGSVVQQTVNALGLDWYVRGVVPRESPASWGTLDCASGAPDCGQRSLEAQAVAARSFALGEARSSYARTCDTTSCQVYLGRAHRSPSGTVTALEAATTSNAVSATAGGVRLMPNGAVARTEFSSSTGGWTAGGTFPSVRDDGDDTASNPYHSWTVTISATTLAEVYGLGALRSAVVTSRSTLDGGRGVTAVRLEFAGGTVTRTGDALRQELGLRSTWFSFGMVAPPDPRPGPGVRRESTWHLRDDLSGGTADLSFAYGLATDLPVVGDWNGDGTDTVGVRRGSTWLLRDSNSGGVADRAFDFGAAGGTAFSGDWNGDGTDNVGVRRGATWELKSANSTGPADVTFAYGLTSDVPVVGDWDGDGRDSPGVFRSGVFYLRNSTSGGVAEMQVATGASGVPIAGDWDGDGTDEVGVRSGSTFLLFRSTGAALTSFSYGVASDVPFAGVWR